MPWFRNSIWIGKYQAKIPAKKDWQKGPPLRADPNWGLQNGIWRRAYMKEILGRLDKFWQGHNGLSLEEGKRWTAQ